MSKRQAICGMNRKVAILPRQSSETYRDQLYEGVRRRSEIDVQHLVKLARRKNTLVETLRKELTNRSTLLTTRGPPSCRQTRFRKSGECFSACDRAAHKSAYHGWRDIRRRPC